MIDPTAPRVRQRARRVFGVARDELDLRRVNDQLFTASLDSREVGRLSVAVGDGVWELYSTVVQPEYEGRGIAGRLVRFALDQADAAGVSVVPTCWYVDGLMRRDSPRYDHLRVQHHPPASSMDDSCRIGPAVVDPE